MNEEQKMIDWCQKKLTPIKIDPAEAGFFDKVLGYATYCPNEEMVKIAQKVVENGMVSCSDFYETKIETFFHNALERYKQSIKDAKLIEEFQNQAKICKDKNVKPFWISPVSIGWDGEKLAFGFGYDTEILSNHTGDWWKKEISEIQDTNFSWRLGDEFEHTAFLVYLVNSLVSKWNFSIDNAIKAVVVSSVNLGNMRFHGPGKPETTGSREVVGLFDLTNLSRVMFGTMKGESKFIAKGPNFWDVGGYVSLNYTIGKPCDGETRQCGCIGWPVGFPK